MNRVLWVILVLGVGNLALGIWMPCWASVGASACTLAYVSVRCQSRRVGKSALVLTEIPHAVVPAARPAPRAPVDPNDTAALADEMLAQGRAALLLRPQIARTLDGQLFGQALDAFSTAMALVPEGEVGLNLDDADAESGRVLRCDAFFLDRYLVTNRLYYEFVAAGGYEQMALWDGAIWPAVLDFVDRTGAPGPHLWREGCYLPGEEELPVVGVCWYEAVACARWLGKRLPSDAEWVKAAAWPVSLAAGGRSQRRYPWGDALDRTKANVWGAGPGRVVAVDQFAAGVSVGGVYQLIGNVWEWTASGYLTERPEGELTLPIPMKSLRGGAFDTYFDNQASCQFQSGDNPLARRHNIGFRCAIGARDVMLVRLPAAETAEAPLDAHLPEEALA